MKKEFKIGIRLESDTEYFATKREYHVYAKDTTEISDDRYVALRAEDTEAFHVFVLMKEKKNIVLDFCGATLVMHGKIQPFLIDQSENITIKNCNVTYDRPPYTEALITEVTPEHIRLRLNENCPCRVEDGKLVPYSDTWENHRLNYNGVFFQLFDSETRHGRGLHLGVIGSPVVMEQDRPFTIDHFTVEEKEGDILLKGEFCEKIRTMYKPNNVLNITHERRSLSSVFMIDSKNITLINYRILSGWGMGIYAYRSKNITLDGFRLTYDNTSPCIVTNAADAIHTFGTSGMFEIRNSVFEGMIDDAINIHSNFRTIEHAQGNEIYTHLASCEQQANELYRIGDEIAVYRGKTMEKTASYIIQKIETVSKTIKKFIVEGPVTEHREGDLIENITANCDVTIENCVFGKANSHLRFQSRGRLVMRNCETEMPILLSGDASYWFESGPITDLTIEDCRFVGERAQIRITSEIFPTAAEPYYHQNLKFINNEFDTDNPLTGGYADGIVFKDNQNRLKKPMTLTLTNCGRVDAENCIVERKTEVKSELNVN